MVGVYRGVVADPCDGLWKAYQDYQRQAALDIASIQHSIDGLNEAIARKRAEAEELRQRIRSIQDEIASQAKQRDYWTEKQAAFDGLASSNEKIVQDCDARLKTLKQKQADLQRESATSSTAEEKTKVQKAIADNEAQQQALITKQAEARTARDNADRLAQFCAGQLKQLEERAAELKRQEDRARGDLDAVENHQLKGLLDDLAHQQDLLKQVKQRLNDALQAWVDCEFSKATADRN
jgi:DNA repair exonuclease SbcCD ATPase subunit